MPDPAKSRILAFQNNLKHQESKRRDVPSEKRNMQGYMRHKPSMEPRQYRDYEDSRMESPARRHPLYYKEESRHFYPPTGIVPSASAAYHYNCPDESEYVEEGIPIDTYPFYNSYGSSSAPAFSNSHSSQYDGDFYSGSSYRNYNDDRYYYEGEISPEYDSRIPARTHRMPAPYMDQDVYPMPSYGAEMVSRAPPVAMESRRLSPSVPRPKKEAKEERRERKESGARSKSKRSAKGQRSPSEAEREAEPNNMAAIWREIEENRGKLLRLATHQTGCRHLQYALGQEGTVMVELLYRELGRQVGLLMTDPFGNYLFQKLVEMSTDEQRRSLLRTVGPQLRAAAKDAHGTRCVQKLIQFCRSADMEAALLDSLLPFVVELSADVNANHVVKRCLTGMDTAARARVIEAVTAHCCEIGEAMYGCSVVQKCIDAATGAQQEALLDGIEAHARELMKDMYANYLIQYLIDSPSAAVSLRFCRCVLGEVVELSKEKCSSNVVEKSLTLGDEATKAAIIEEIVTAPNLLELLLDNYANYVIQKAIVLSNRQQRNELRSAILPYRNHLMNSKVGKHILSKIDDSASPLASSSPDGRIPMY